eukprot:6201613-Pleurochrysis_carterae.AAC.4
MPCKAISHAAQNSAGDLMAARDTGQAIFKCPEPVPARATTKKSLLRACAEARAVHKSITADSPNHVSWIKAK